MADLSDDDIRAMWETWANKWLAGSELNPMLRFARAVLAADRALNAPQAAPVAQATPDQTKG